MQASIPFTKVEFDKTKIAEFYPKVRQRVEEYFKTNNLSRHANGFMIFKTLFILSGFLACYFMILSNAFTPLMTLLLAGTLGFFTAMIGLNIGHDAIHGAFSSNATVNKYVGVLFNLAGANDYVWRIKHNIVHHTFTNIPEHDDDINGKRDVSHARVAGLAEQLLLAGVDRNDLVAVLLQVFADVVRGTLGLGRQADHGEGLQGEDALDGFGGVRLGKAAGIAVFRRLRSRHEPRPRRSRHGRRRTDSTPCSPGRSTGRPCPRSRAARCPRRNADTRG